MSHSFPLRLTLALLALAILACEFSAPSAPAADPNAFNTMVALTALVRPTIPPAVTAPPNLPPPPTIPPTITPTQGPPVLVSATINLPRHTALDLETKAVSGILADMNKINQNLPDFRYYKKAPAGADLVYYSENPTNLSWQFLYPVNGTRLAFPKPELLQASYEGCVQAFKGGGMVVPGKENEAFPLDYYVFVTAPGQYYCFTTDRGNLGAFTLSAPGDYKNMPYVIMEYILWDARLP